MKLKVGHPGKLKLTLLCWLPGHNAQVQQRLDRGVQTFLQRNEFQAKLLFDLFIGKDGALKTETDTKH